MRLGIFGGSFDPVHRGHLLLADCCCTQAQFDEVWFMPTASQPLKPAGPVASDDDRLAMLELVCAKYRRYGVSRVELDRGGVSYTVNTLEYIHAQRPNDELFFLMGADSLADLPRWHRPADICRLATPLVVHRAETAEPDFGVLALLLTDERLQEIRRQQVEMPPTPISSSQIRSRIANGGEWENFVPDDVAAYIREHRLYAGKC